MYLHHNLLNIYQKNIDHLISPSHFLKNKFIKFGWPENKFSVIHNPFDNDLERQLFIEKVMMLNPLNKYHCLGFIEGKIINSYPWFSCDSNTWAIPF